MQIKLASITVDEQERALSFYTTILGFTKKTDVSMGTFRWLTVCSPEGVEGVELVLEPIGFPPTRECLQTSWNPKSDDESKYAPCCLQIDWSYRSRFGSG